MIGVEEITYYIPEGRSSNYQKKSQFDISDDFIEKKLGIKEVSISGKEEDTSDLCFAAFEKLMQQTSITPPDIEVIVVCTQNPDFKIPHTSAIVHGKFGFSNHCAAFDISLGCSGFVYGLSVIESFMNSNDMRYGLLFTADPYSKIVDTDDKNTSVIFGDAATVTLISRDPILKSGLYSFGTIGKDYEHLIYRDGKLVMSGREIFNFAARIIPEDIKRVLKKNTLEIQMIDRFLLHQGSKYIVDFIAKRTSLPKEKTPFDIEGYGNTVSSSIPIMLSQCAGNLAIKNILISGFGVGLSWASGILTRV